jgi:hypothetical protein
VALLPELPAAQDPVHLLEVLAPAS